MSENNDVNMNVFVELCKFFKCSDFKESVVLWEKTTPIKENRLYIVESGQALLYSVYETSNLIIKEKVIGTLIPCKFLTYIYKKFMNIQYKKHLYIDLFIHIYFQFFIFRFYNFF